MGLRKDDATPARLGAADRRTYAALHRHPAPEDLSWRDVRALLGALCDVQEARKGSLKVTRRGVMMTFHAQRQPLSLDEIVEVQHFLERSSEGVSMPVVVEGTQLLVAIDAQGARIYRLELGPGPGRLEPFRGNGYPAQLLFFPTRADGEPQPVRVSFYKDLARALRGAERILLVACGAGGASAMEALRTELARGRADLSLRVVGALVMKGTHPSEAQLLARAKKFFAELG